MKDNNRLSLSFDMSFQFLPIYEFYDFKKKISVRKKIDYKSTTGADL